MNIKRLYSALMICGLLILMSACSKQETFLGPTSFTSKVNIKAYVPSNNAYFKISIDDSTWTKVKVDNISSLAEILSTDVLPKASGKSHLTIWWKNTDAKLVDTSIALKGINTFYLIQLDKSKPPTFFFNFGSDNGALPDSSHVKARIYYSRDSAAITQFPDSIRIKFFRLSKNGTDYVQEEDTSITVKEGIVSDYFELPDTYYYSESSHGGLAVSVGYELYDAATGVKLQDFCPKYNYGTLELNVTTNGVYQTLSFDYLPDASGCNFGDPTEEYQLKVLFGSK